MSGLYRTVWRWHFYAGLFVVSMIVILPLCAASVIVLWLFDRLALPRMPQTARGLGMAEV